MKQLLVLILIAGIMISGCTAPSGPANTGGQNGGAVQQGGAVNPGQQTGQNTGQENGQQDQNNGGGQQPGNDLLDKTYGELMALGVPLQCDITITDETGSTTARVYMKGENEIRSEMQQTSSASTCPKIITIMKDAKAYVGCEGGSMFPDTGGASNPFAGCVWMEMDINKSTTATASVGEEPPDYSQIPPTQINCVPWIYDASKFAVTGKSCNIQEIMNSMNVPSNY